MKNLLMLPFLSVTLIATAGKPPNNIEPNIVKCIQHEETIGFVISESSITDVIGRECFDRYKDTPIAKLNESIKEHDEYSPECWKGDKGFGHIGSIGN